MAKKIIITIFLFSLSILGCSDGLQNSIRSAANAAGMIGIKDIQQETILEGNLPRYLGIDKKIVSVDPGPGYSKVTIQDDDKVYSLEKIVNRIEEFRAANPQINPIHVTLKRPDGELQINEDDFKILQKASQVLNELKTYKIPATSILIENPDESDLAKELNLWCKVALKQGLTVDASEYKDGKIILGKSGTNGPLLISVLNLKRKDGTYRTKEVWFAKDNADIAELKDMVNTYFNGVRRLYLSTPK